MPLEPDRLLAHYRLIDKLGQGGMGVVWRAEDTRLGRHVAVKLLPPEFAADAERLARFDREARLLASLNHPNVGALYAIEEVGGERFLVLELIPGETLAERIERGPLPVDEALGAARQIATALAAAHAAGVLHRDLKPANVKVTPDGQVKVLDFGLAKGFVADSSGATSPAMSPTLTGLGTQAGLILGTAAYMSPEQARGKVADKRADLWGLGCILFEALTGRRLFAGETVSDTLAAVLKENPGWESLPDAAPPSARRLLRRLLAKDPSRRAHDAADVVLDLDDALAELAAGPEPPSVALAPSAPAPRSRALLPWVLLVVATAAAGWSTWRASRHEPIPSTPVTASIVPPPGAGFAGTAGLALSPDGSRLVAAVRGPDGIRRLWLRPLGRAAGEMLAGTDEAQFPFWAPDGRRIGFMTNAAVKTIDLESHVVESIARMGEASGGSWSAGGDIVLGARNFGSILHLPAGGGEPVEVTRPDDANDVHVWPWFLPDGRHFLFLVRDYGAERPLGEIRLGSLDGGPSRKLVAANSAAVAASGFLAWWHDGNLRAQRFDADRLELEGESFVLAAGAGFDPRIGYAPFTLSAAGDLVFQEGGGEVGDELVWLDRDGRALGTLGKTASYYGPTLSPDGATVATDISDETNRGDIWLLDVGRGAETRFTSWPEDDSAPVWSPAGDEVAFFSARGGAFDALYARSLRGTTEPRLLARDAAAKLAPSDWSRNGDLLVERREGEATDLWVHSIRDATFRPYQAGPFVEQTGAFSPDGRFVAFCTDETGRLEIYLATFPEPGQRWRVSADGGEQPVWRRDGGELYYLSPDNRLLAVELRLPPDGRGEVSIGTPRALFQADFKRHRRAQYDTIDGRRFLVNRTVDAGATRPLTLVLRAFARAERP